MPNHAISKQPITDFERIIVTGDAFRATFNAGKEITLTQRGNVEWLHEMLLAPLQQTTGLQPELDHLFRRADAAPLLDAIAAAAIDGHPSELWARGFDSAELLNAHFGELLKHYDRSLVLGFELSPGFRAILQSRGIAYVDFEVHPIRFMPDLMFCVNSNLEPLMTRLETLCIADECIRLQASLMRARQRKTGVWNGAPALLFTAQVARDRSMIQDSRMVSLADYADEFLAEASRHQLVVAKPHPLQPFDPPTREVLAQVPDLRLYEGNLYDLLASGRVGKLITLSSSSGFEAPYFRIESHRMMHQGSITPPAFGIDLFAASTWAWLLGADSSPPRSIAHHFSAGSVRLSHQAFDKAGLELSAGQAAVSGNTS